MDHKYKAFVHGLLQGSMPPFPTPYPEIPRPKPYNTRLYLFILCFLYSLLTRIAYCNCSSYVSSFPAEHPVDSSTLPQALTTKITIVMIITRVTIAIVIIVIRIIAVIVTVIAIKVIRSAGSGMAESYGVPMGPTYLICMWF